MSPPNTDADEATDAPVSAIRNLGPASEVEYARAGINSADEMRALGADAAYLRLLQTGTHPHFIGYYALVMGLQGRPWNDCQGDEKAALRIAFDKLKTKAKNAEPDGAPSGAPEGIERFLNRIGVVPSAKQAGK